MVVLNFKILGQAVPEKSLTKQKLTDRQTILTETTNSRPRGRNFALNGAQGEVGVSLKKK